MAFLTDTHCHLNLPQFDSDLETVINEAHQRGIKKILVPGTDIPTSERAIKIAERFPEVYAAVGIHPNDGLKWDSQSYKKLQSLAKMPKVVAIGEIGLDYYWKDCPEEIQKNILRDQLMIADENQLPVILHSRNSLVDLIKLITDWISLREPDPSNRPLGVFHAFEGNLEDAFIIKELNFYIGIGGPVTYKNALMKQQIAKDFPISSILLETDSPYLSPHPFRGKRNQPSNIYFVAEKVSQIRETQLKLIVQETTNNADILFAWEY